MDYSAMETENLIGVGLYPPAEAGRLLRISPGKLSRWLRGHRIGNKFYPPLWTPEISLGDERIFLGFRDLIEARVADAFIAAGVSAIKVRAAIDTAKDVIGEARPLSTNRFRTDGREIFLQIVEKDEDGQEREHLLNLFRRQFVFNGILDPVLKTVDFGSDGNPLTWWPGGRRLNVIVDPARSFGQPIDAASSVPTAVLAAAAEQEGGIRGAAKAYDVSEASVRHAVEFEAMMEQRLAA
ncbi:hypothetical protein [Rhizobium esperanzae]|uniref:Uncharacterized protein (DUF433 family) n=1 Tax=Rhizobium esperanzae TaxID=1967781 RepID=A0A7W6R464_9HYPH|nr:hypothetical protein [Rhizobium esperanzae]MBB4235942.1 uncharacterized protein (DUF433 family) [Rhizobium esperanzae]